MTRAIIISSAVCGILFGFLFGLQRGESAAITEQRDQFAPRLADKDKVHASLRTDEFPVDPATLPFKDWMPFDYRRASLSEILAKASVIDLPKAILAHVQALPPDRLQSELANVFSTPVSKKDFARALAAHLLLLRYAEVDPTAALAFARSLGPNQREYAQSVIVATVAEDDLAEAARIADALDEAQNEGIAPSSGWTSEVVAAAWAKDDPDSAMQWAHTIKREDNRVRAMASILANTPVDRRTATAIAIADPDERALATGSFVRKWASYNPQGALQWALDQEPYFGRYHDCVSCALDGWSRIDPRAAAQYLTGMPTLTRRQRNIRRQTMPRIVPPYFVNQPGDAVDFVESLPESPARNMVIEEIRKVFVVVGRLVGMPEKLVTDESHPSVFVPVAFVEVNHADVQAIQESAFHWESHTGDLGLSARVFERILEANKELNFMNQDQLDALRRKTSSTLEPQVERLDGGELEPIIQSGLDPRRADDFVESLPGGAH